MPIFKQICEIIYNIQNLSIRILKFINSFSDGWLKQPGRITSGNQFRLQETNFVIVCQTQYLYSITVTRRVARGWGGAHPLKIIKSKMTGGVRTPPFGCEPTLLQAEYVPSTPEKKICFLAPHIKNIPILILGHRSASGAYNCPSHNGRP